MRYTPSLAVLGMCLCGVAAAQTPEPQVPRQTSPPVPMPATATPGAGESLFLRGVPSGKATSETLPLSLSDAVNRGLKHNLGLLIGEQGTRSAEAARYRSLSRLLPEVTTRIAEVGQQSNLKAFGFSGFPGIQPIVGPFNILDARVLATQPILDLAAMRNLRASADNLKAAQYSYQDARDVVVLAVVSLYLQALAGRARIDAVRAQLNTAQALYQRAVNMKNGGVVAGIDVLQAQGAVATANENHISSLYAYNLAKATLARAAGGAEKSSLQFLGLAAR